MALDNPGKHARHWTVNPYEQAARYNKAFAIALHLQKHHIDADELHLITHDQWRELAKMCGVNQPSDETIAVVKVMLRTLEREQKGKS